jgi:hypothetical protein
LKEAAEKNQMVGQADYHRVVSGGTVANPLNWSTTEKLQATLATWSTMQIPTQYTSTGVGNMFYRLPIGVYDFYLFVDLGGAGASTPQWSGYATAQTGYNILDNAYQIGINGTNTIIFCWVRAQVTQPGLFQVFVYNNAATSTWTIANARSTVVPMPVNDTSLLMHKDFKIRSLAWSKIRDGSAAQNRIENAVERALIASGVKKKEETKENKYDVLIQQRHDELLESKAVCICGRFGCSLCTPSVFDTTPSTCQLCIERFGQSQKQRIELKQAALRRTEPHLSLDEDDWEDQEYKESPPARKLFSPIIQPQAQRKAASSKS